MKKLVIGLLALVSVPVLAQDRVTKFDTDGDNRVSLVELSAKCTSTSESLGADPGTP